MDVLEMAVTMEGIISTPPAITKVVMNKPMRYFRTASEMSTPHGNYLDGAIVFDHLPGSHHPQRLEISMVPSESSPTLTQHMIHPSLICLTLKEQRSRVFKTDLNKPQSWRLPLIIHKRQVYFVDDADMKVPICTIPENENCLSLGNDSLKLTIITPLKTNTRGKGVTVDDIVKERFNFDVNRPFWNGTPQTVTKQYTDSKSSEKHQLKRCRLRACLYEDETAAFKVSEQISETISDTRDKNFGTFEVDCMSEPHGCCSNGNWKYFLISKAEVGTSNNKTGSNGGCYPVFVLAKTNDEESPQKVENLFKNFRQISSAETEVRHNSTFIFTVPSQDKFVVKALEQYSESLYVTLFRQSDGKYAKNMIKFDYEVHDETEEDCAFCCISSKTSYHGSTFGSSSAKKRKASPRHRYESTTSGVSSPQSVVTNSDDLSYLSYQDMNIPSIPEFDQLLEANDFQSHTAPENSYATLDLSCFDFVRDGKPRDGASAAAESDTGSEESTDSESMAGTEEEYDADVEVLCLSAKNLGIATKDEQQLQN